MFTHIFKIIIQLQSQQKCGPECKGNYIYVKKNNYPKNQVGYIIIPLLVMLNSITNF